MNEQNIQNENNVPAAVIDDLFGKFFFTMSTYYFENGQMMFSSRSQTISSIVYSFSNKNSAPNTSQDDTTKRLKVDGGL